MLVVTTALLMDTMIIAWMELETLTVVPLAMTEAAVAASVETGAVAPSANPCITQVRTSIPLAKPFIYTLFLNIKDQSLFIFYI